MLPRICWGFTPAHQNQPFQSEKLHYLNLNLRTLLRVSLCSWPLKHPGVTLQRPLSGLTLSQGPVLSESIRSLAMGLTSGCTSISGPALSGEFASWHLDKFQAHKNFGLKMWTSTKILQWSCASASLAQHLRLRNPKEDASAKTALMSLVLAENTSCKVPNIWCVFMSEYTFSWFIYHYHYQSFLLTQIFIL